MDPNTGKSIEATIPRKCNVSGSLQTAQQLAMSAAALSLIRHKGAGPQGRALQLPDLALDSWFLCCHLPDFHKSENADSALPPHFHHLLLEYVEEVTHCPHLHDSQVLAPQPCLRLPLLPPEALQLPPQLPLTRRRLLALGLQLSLQPQHGCQLGGTL